MTYMALAAAVSKRRFFQDVTGRVASIKTLWSFSCNFAADGHPVFITDTSKLLSAVFPLASPLPCDGSG